MIKLLEQFELDDVMQIWLEVNIQAHNFISQEYWKENFDMVKSLLPQSNVLVYKANDSIKGFIGIVENNYIAGLFVLNQYQSSGIGSKLLEECKQRYSELRLDVFVKNKSAVNFYLKHGFKIEQKKLNEDLFEQEYTMIWRS